MRLGYDSYGDAVRLKISGHLRCSMAPGFDRAAAFSTYKDGVSSGTSSLWKADVDVPCRLLRVVQKVPRVVHKLLRVAPKMLRVAQNAQRAEKISYALHFLHNA